MGFFAFFFVVSYGLELICERLDPKDPYRGFYPFAMLACLILAFTLSGISFLSTLNH